MFGIDVVQCLMIVSLFSVLQDDVQAVINVYIIIFMEVVVECWENEEVYRVYFDYLAKVVELVGESSFFFWEIKVWEYYFWGVNF